MSNKYLKLKFGPAKDPIHEAPKPKGWAFIGWRDCFAEDWTYISGWTPQTLNEARTRGKLTSAQVRIPETCTFALYVQPVRS